MSAPMKDAQPVLVRMGVEMRAELARISEEEDRTMAQTIRRAVRLYIEKAHQDAQR
jgi:predicted DNA-binding protein